MLDFCRFEIEGDIESNVKKNIFAKEYIDFQAQRYFLNQIKIIPQKLHLQRPTVYRINGNSKEISIDFSSLR